MRDVELNEDGRSLFFNAGVDISTSTSYSVDFIKPSGDAVNVVAALGIVDATVKDKEGVEVTVPANTYVSLVIPTGLIDQLGRWSYKLLAPTATSSIPGACGSFNVVS